jgi:predicted ATPase
MAVLMVDRRVGNLPVDVTSFVGRRREGLAQYEAVSLFVDRASAVHPGFSLDAGNQLAVAGICRRLEGIPLAVELAAGRMRAAAAVI